MATTKEHLTHRLRRPVNGLHQTPGECVDATQWKNIDALVSMRYAEPLAPGMLRHIVEGPSGRWWYGKVPQSERRRTRARPKATKKLEAPETTTERGIEALPVNADPPQHMGFGKWQLHGPDSEVVTFPEGEETADGEAAAEAQAALWEGVPS